jgi:hypothetical protein
MTQPTEKTCPRCGRRFVCGADDPNRCQCTRATLSPEVLAALRKTYEDCLCLECLKAMASDANRCAGQADL